MVSVDLHRDDLGSIIVQAIGGGVAASANHGSVYNKALLGCGGRVDYCGDRAAERHDVCVWSLIFDFWMRRRKAIASGRLEKATATLQILLPTTTPAEQQKHRASTSSAGPRLRHTDDSHPLYLPTTGNGGWVGEPADEERDGVLNSGWDDDRVGEHCVDGGASRVVVSADEEGKEGGRGKEEEGWFGERRILILRERWWRQGIRRWGTRCEGRTGEGRALWCNEHFNGAWRLSIWKDRVVCVAYDHRLEAYMPAMNCRLQQTCPLLLC